MPQFRVPIGGETLERAMAMLNHGAIPTIGMFPAYFVEPGPAGDWQLNYLTAMPDAETPEEAGARVREVLPDDYTVGPAEFVEPLS
jgi:hypothetical protein